jgi:hypothetical protein
VRESYLGITPETGDVHPAAGPPVHHQQQTRASCA